MHIIAIMNAITTIRGSGVVMNDIWLLSFKPSIHRNVKRLIARLKIPQPPKTYIGFAAARSRNLTTSKSRRTLTTRSSPYFELPVRRGLMIHDHFGDFRAMPGSVDG